MYGFAPPLNGRTAVHQIILRNDIVIMPRSRGRQWWASPTLGANLLLETGEHTFLTLPDQFPKGYYHPPQLHGTFSVGGRVARALDAMGPFREISFSLDLTALDTYLWYGISQRGAPVHKAFGISLAMAVAL